MTRWAGQLAEGGRGRRRAFLGVMPWCHALACSAVPRFQCPGCLGPSVLGVLGESSPSSTADRENPKPLTFHPSASTGMYWTMN